MLRRCCRCEARGMFLGTVKHHCASALGWEVMTEFSFWVNFSFKIWASEGYPGCPWEDPWPLRFWVGVRPDLPVCTCIWRGGNETPTFITNGTFKAALCSSGNKTLIFIDCIVFMFNKLNKQTAFTRSLTLFYIVYIWRTLPPLQLQTVFWGLYFPLRTGCFPQLYEFVFPPHW